ncbi:MAG TPA: hypothetical protein VFV50_13700 [Bdellovibrionales bacterium]|nr:hypothetical protein [Bdellovibrionales bacterium]
MKTLIIGAAGDSLNRHWLRLIKSVSREISGTFEWLEVPVRPDLRVEKLASSFQKHRPDCVFAVDFENAAVPAFEVWERARETSRPAWAVFDIHGGAAASAKGAGARLRSRCRAFLSPNQDDASSLGTRHVFVPQASLLSPSPGGAPAAANTIVLSGSAGLDDRPLVALQAVRTLFNELGTRKIAVLRPSYHVAIASELLRQEGLAISIARDERALRRTLGPRSLYVHLNVRGHPGPIASAAAVRGARLVLGREFYAAAWGLKSSSHYKCDADDPAAAARAILRALRDERAPKALEPRAGVSAEHLIRKALLRLHERV